MEDKPIPSYSRWEDMFVDLEKGKNGFSSPWFGFVMIRGNLMTSFALEEFFGTTLHRKTIVMIAVFLSS